MTNRVDRYNYSFFEKRSIQLNNTSHGANSSTGKAKVAAISYNEFPRNCNNAIPHSTKKEQAQALDKECKRMTVLYPFLSKSQIRSKAKESLSNVPKTAPRKRRLTTTSKGKAALNFINEPKTSLNKSKEKRQNDGDEKESKLVPKSKTHCKETNERHRLYDYDHDDSDDSCNETEDDYNDDPDYNPSSKDKNAPKPMMHKTKQTHSLKTKKSNKTSETSSACGFMELTENSFTHGDEYEAAEKQPTSKIKPIKETLALCKAQPPITPAISMSNKTYTMTDKYKDAFIEKPKEVSFNQTVETLSADDVFDNMRLDEGTPLSHVSESPDSTTDADFPRTACGELNSAAHHSVTVPSSAKSYSIFSSHLNVVTKERCSQSCDDIFPQSEKQQPKPFPKFSIENGYEVITLSSDSEDDATSTSRSISQDIRCLSINSYQIKVEKDESKLSNAHGYMKEQPKKTFLANRSTMANIADSRNKIPMLRGILKTTQQGKGEVTNSNTQTSRPAQTPKLIKCQSTSREMKNVATQMTPPRAYIQNKIRPQMKDKASEANLDDATNSESSSLDSPCFISKPFPASIQQQKKEVIHHFDKTMIGRARQFQCTKVATPKLCSVQTQTDSSIVSDNRNDTSFHFLPSQPMHRPLQHSETPRKRYVSWKEDRVFNLLEKNVAKSHETEDKQIVLSTQRESEHDRLLYSVKVELELLNKKIKSENSNTLGEQKDSIWDFSPESDSSVQEIPLEVLAQKDDLSNAWCDMLNSPIRSHGDLNFGASKTNVAALENKIDAGLNANVVKNTDQRNTIEEQTAFRPSSITCAPAMLSLGKDYPTTKFPRSLLDSQESTEVSCSSTSSNENISTYEGDCEANSEASSLTSSPIDFCVLNEKFAIKGATSTPALTATLLPKPEPSLLESLLEKMRRFDPNSGINEQPEKFPPTLKRPPFSVSQNKVLSEPSQKKLRATNPCIMIQDSAIISSNRILASTIPKTPQNAVKNAYEDSLLNDCSMKTPARIQALDRQTQICTKTEQCAEEITAMKDNLLCDLFDVATPKSAGGTIHRYLGYSEQFHPRVVCDEECWEEFG